MEVGLHQEVGALGQGYRDTLRKEGGRGAGHPSAESAIERAERVADGEDGAEAGESGLAVHTILLARAAGGVGEEQRVMDHASRGGLQLDGADPFVRGEVGGNDEVAVDVGAVGGHGKGGGHFQNQVGRAELPAIGVLRRERRFGRVAQRHAAVHPLLDERDLVGGEAALIAIRGPARLGLPGRHVARLRHGGDGARVGAHVVVGQQGERRHLAGTVALGAVAVDDGRDVFVEGDGLRAADARGGGKQENRPQVSKQVGESPLCVRDSGTAVDDSTLRV